MSHTRLFKLKQSAVSEPDGSTSFSAYVDKVLMQLNACVNYSDYDYQHSFGNVQNTLSSDYFREIYRRVQVQFIMKHAAFHMTDTQAGRFSTCNTEYFEEEDGLCEETIALNTVKSEPVCLERIASQYDNMEAYYNEIQKIRDIDKPEEAISYLNRAMQALYLDPRSSFMPPLVLEAFIRHEMFLMVDVQAGINEQGLCSVTENLQQMKVSDTAQGEAEIGKINPNTTNPIFSKVDELFLTRYMEYLKLLYAAHTLCLPRFAEVIKDEVPSAHDVRTFGL